MAVFQQNFIYEKRHQAGRGPQGHSLPTSIVEDKTAHAWAWESHCLYSSSNCHLLVV